jgi:hypothetical protein
MLAYDESGRGETEISRPKICQGGNILSMEEKNKYETIFLMWSWWDARNKTKVGE